MGKKSEKSKGGCKVFYADLWGKKESKYDFLLANDIKSVEWKELKPEKENYFFSIKDLKSINQYEEGFKIDEIINKYTTGVTTGNDKLFVSFQRSKIYNYSYAYNPFDNRYIDYLNKNIQRKRFEVMNNLLNSNLGISLMKKIIPDSFSHILVVDKILDKNFYGFQSYIFPLYIYQENGDNNGNGFIYREAGKQDNFTKEFRQFIIEKYKHSYTPEQILGYIYTVLHSPAYRTKYIEFLKIDFPRIPFTDDEELFRELSEIGFDLIEHHLLKETYNTYICRMKGSGQNYKVEKVEYEELKPGECHEADLLCKVTGDKSGRVWFNKERCFEPVPEAIWNFHIGGYQVLEKWLKERKKHEISLSGEDARHFVKVVNVLDYTIKTMKHIDELTREWI